MSGHRGRYPMREIVNAILYQERTGCGWEYLPHDLPPRSAVYYYFGRWLSNAFVKPLRLCGRGCRECGCGARRAAR
ncbi:transposase [Actinomadura sp. WMMB 499]|uniref:transposase n=1 Tax=Actinomadura sp. WMMB 499 TaxID=1219491 RepID=UPI0034A0BCF0